MIHAETVTFGGSGLDRAAELRADFAGLAQLAAVPGARAITLWRGKPLVAGEGRDHLVRLPLNHPLFADVPSAIFLGREEGQGVWAHDLSAWDPEDVDFSTLGAFLDPSEQHHPDLPADHCFAELRSVMTRLSPRDAELAATAKAVMGWHLTHGFCARCGAVSQILMAGWQRTCTICGAHHFPRTDPVAIMMVTKGDKCLLGQGLNFPSDFYSCLAGFIEPGETIEQGVRREIMEESAIEIGDVRYQASQPWPYPSSLMIGCFAEAVSEEITVDKTELKDARWFAKDQVREMLKCSGNPSGLRMAAEMSLAHQLAKAWVE